MKIIETSICIAFVILQLVADSQNPGKDKAMEAEKAKPQNLKSNLTWKVPLLTTTATQRHPTEKRIGAVRSVPSHIKVHKQYFEDATVFTNKQVRVKDN